MTAIEERKIDGTWWVAGNTGPSYFGTLTCSLKRLRLVIKVPHSMTMGEVMLQGTDALNDVPNVILGRNAHGQPITLFGCFCRTDISEGLKTQRIDAIAAIDGLEIPQWDHPAIHTVSINVDPISVWLGGNALIPSIQNGKQEGFTLPPPTDISFKLSEGIEMRIWRSTGISSRAEKMSFTHQSSVWLQFDEPRSLQDISDNWVHWVDRFFSLLLGSRIRHRSVTCRVDRFFGEHSKPLGRKGELIRQGSGEPTPADENSLWDMVTRYAELSPDLEAIVTKWTTVAERYEALVDLFAVAAFNQSLHTEAEFLVLVQALEVYHARCPSFESTLVPAAHHKDRVDRATAAAPSDLTEWVRQTLRNANNKHLDERLSEVFKHHINESTKILGTDPALPERIRYTRNHLTHHTNDGTSPKLLKPDELVQVAWNLRTFIWVCLLKEIGVSGVPLDRLIRKYEGRFVGLT